MGEGVWKSRLWPVFFCMWMAKSSEKCFLTGKSHSCLAELHRMHKLGFPWSSKMLTKNRSEDQKMNGRAYCILRNSVLCETSGICIIRKFHVDICNLRNIFSNILRKIWIKRCEMRIFRIMQFEMLKFRTIEIFLGMNSAKYRQMNIFFRSLQ